MSVCAFLDHPALLSIYCWNHVSCVTNAAASSCYMAFCTCCYSELIAKRVSSISALHTTANLCRICRGCRKTTTDLLLSCPVSSNCLHRSAVHNEHAVYITVYITSQEFDGEQTNEQAMLHYICATCFRPLYGGARCSTVVICCHALKANCYMDMANHRPVQMGANVIHAMQALRQALTKSQRHSTPAVNPLVDTAQSFFSKGFKNLNTNLNNVKHVFQPRVRLALQNASPHTL